MAQSAVISARSGLIHYVEGQVYVGDQLVETKFGVFPEVKENQQLRTEEGRAEVLLTPGVFLRVGENSAFRMVTNRLIDTRLELLAGAAVVEADDIAKDNSVTVVFKDATVHPVKKGVYRLDTSNNTLRVFDGEAEVASGDRTLQVKEGHLIDLDTLTEHKFDKAATDALDRWSERRDGYVSMANVAAANTLRSSMFGGASSLYMGGFMGGWYFNPFMGMYSFVPGFGGMFYSPYGNAFFSPFDVYMAFAPGFYYPYFGYGNGYRGYGYGNYGYGASRYGNTYSSLGYKTVPAPGRPGTTAMASSASAAAPHGPSHGSSGFSSTSSFPSFGNAAPISHGAGAAAGNSGHH